MASRTTGDTQAITAIGRKRLAISNPVELTATIYSREGLFISGCDDDLKESTFRNCFVSRTFFLSSSMRKGDASASEESGEIGIIDGI
jgi:hypothetical protein